MLFTRTLYANQWDSLDVTGKHLNLILAAGVVRMEALTAQGQPYSTNMISGMSPENFPKYSRISFKSPIDQTIQFWASEMPLTYSPETSRLVGSNSLSSTYAEAYSGIAQLLLPAETGRNKVTIAPTQDIIVGGVNLSLKTGIPIAAGSIFEFNTQGAIYALETSGAYPPVISTEATFADFAAPDLIALPSTSYKMIAANAALDEYWITDGTATIYRRSKDTHATVGTISGIQVPTAQDYQVFDTGEHFEWGRTHNIGNIARWIKVNKTTFAVTITDIGFSEVMYSTYYDGIRYALNRLNGQVYSSPDGVAWSTLGVPMGVVTPASVKGFDVNSQGWLFIIADGAINRSTDDGATWTDGTLVYGVDTESGWSQMAINKNNDKIYYCSDTSNHTMAVSIDDGNTFELLFGFEMGSGGSGVSAYYMHFLGDTLYISGATLMIQYNENVGRATYVRVSGSQVREIHAGNDGRIYWTDNDGLYIVQGELVQSGGVPVAILAEVN